MTASARWHSGVASPMRDGVVLISDVWACDEPSPAVVFRTPYGRRKLTSDVLRPADCVAAGYAAIVQDTRGRFDSGGEWAPIMWAQEAIDTYDTVEWVARQPWCDGRVVLAGTSYGGIVAFLGAAQHPPGLVGVAAAMVTTGAQDRWETGGALRLDHVVSWLVFMAAEWLTRNPELADTAEAEKLRRLLVDPQSAMEALPLAGIVGQLDGLSFDIASYFGSRGMALPDWRIEDLAVPQFLTTGWFDVFCTATIDTFVQGTVLKPDLAHRLVVGPWCHTGSLSHLQGELNFGVSASAGAIALGEQQLRFFREVGSAAPLEPVHQVSYFLMGADCWQTAESWPPAGATATVLHLHPGAGAEPGVSSAQPPDEPGVDSYRYDPLSPVPSRGGRLLHLGRLAPGPLDLAWQLRRDDVLAYRTSPLASDVDVTGRVRVDLRVSVDRVDTDLVVRLVDCHPDGRVYPIAEGITRARFRSSPTSPELLEPGQIYTVRVDLGYTAARFVAGHRIGVLVTSSNFPHLDRNPNTGCSSVDTAEVATATVSIHHPGSFLTIDVLPEGS